MHYSYAKTMTNIQIEDLRGSQSSHCVPKHKFIRWSKTSGFTKYVRGFIHDEHPENFLDVPK